MDKELMREDPDGWSRPACQQDPKLRVVTHEEPEPEIDLRDPRVWKFPGWDLQ